MDSSQNSIDSGDFETDENNVENLIRGSSCMRSCTASTAKRMIMYRRDWCNLLCSIIIPITLVLFGLYLSSGPSKLKQSPPRHLSTGWYPSKQRILMNDLAVAPDTDEGAVNTLGSELFAMLPNGTDFWSVEYLDTTGSYNYTAFYDAVYEYRNNGTVNPYRYGSFELYTASKTKHLYTMVTYLNTTSQDVTGMFPQFMYEAILRVESGDPDFTYSITTVPYPIYQAFLDIEEAASAYDFVFMTAIALALIPCAMV